MKRLLDIVVSLFLLGLFFVPAAIIFLLLKITYGQAIFKQTRPGLNDKPFTMYKFKTMRDMVTTNEQNRLTVLGRLLRKTSLDELPQLLNVLNGEMSMVGPRPLLMEYVEHPDPMMKLRHSVKPGLTGLVQVKGRNSLSWEEKFNLDIYYVQNRNILLDLKILFLTVFNMVSFNAAETQIPEKYKGTGK